MNVTRSDIACIIEYGYSQEVCLLKGFKGGRDAGMRLVTVMKTDDEAALL